MPKPSLQRLRDSRRGFIRVEPKSEFAVAWGDAEFRGMDVSVYGLSFLVPSGSPLMARLGLEARLAGLRFTLEGRSLEVGAIVKHLQSIEDKRRGRLVRVGVEFEAIQPEDVWFLSNYTVKAAVPKPALLKVDLRKLLRAESMRKKKKKPRKPKATRRAPARKAKKRVRKTRR